MRVARTRSDMQGVREAATDAGQTLALVPTMGYLHEGHLRLVDLARKQADETVLSIYVNPTQFGAGEDLESYPRDLERDLGLAESRGVDVAFVPSDREMYPQPQSVWVDPGDELGGRLCGASRPAHFRGVLTVVAKLFGIVQPDVAVFGRKDYQQAILIRRMVGELALPVRIELAPIVREPDGLAMSSRNAYLTEAQRSSALGLARALRAVREAFAGGERTAQRLAELARDVMEVAGVRVDYAEVVHPDDLSPVSEAEPASICAVAGYVGTTRLIDNAPVAGPSSLENVGA